MKRNLTKTIQELKKRGYKNPIGFSFNKSTEAGLYIIDLFSGMGHKSAPKPEEDKDIKFLDYEIQESDIPVLKNFWNGKFYQNETVIYIDGSKITDKKVINMFKNIETTKKLINKLELEEETWEDVMSIDDSDSDHRYFGMK